MSEVSTYRTDSSEVEMKRDEAVCSQIELKGRDRAVVDSSEVLSSELGREWRADSR